MVKITILLALISSVSLSMAQYKMRYPNSYYIPDNWPKHTITLTEKGELKELFDAGLHPGYTSMIKRRELDLKHVRLNFILADGQTLPEFIAEQGRITVTRAGLLRLRFISQPLSVEEAKSTMLEWLPFFSEKRQKTVVLLDDFLTKVAADYSGYDDRNFGAAPEGFSGSWKDSNDIGYGVRFQKAYNEVLPVRIYFNVGWYYIRTAKETRTFYDRPIPAPKGYEIPTLKNWGPDDTSEMMYAKNIPFLPGRGLSGKDQNNVVEATVKFQSAPQAEPRIRPKPKGIEEKTPEFEERPSRLLWLMAGVFSLGILFLIFKTLKGKSSSSY